MASIISAGTTSGTALNLSGDTSGALQLATNGTTTALSISTAQVVTLTNALLEASGGTGTTIGYNGFKNRIINGAMGIDQRNAGASVTPTNGQYTLDRWAAQLSQASKFTVQQSSTAPVGFINSLKVTSSSAYTVGSSEVFLINQYIEGLNVTDLAWGTANAKTVTLSFQVYSSLTGTFGGSIADSSQAYSYPFTYSIPTANTWTTISITIAGPTAGTWLTTNGIGIRIWFGLGVGATLSGTAGAWTATGYYSATGAVSVVGTSGATFYITGVQLEKGSTATSFDYRPYGTELSLCQRYYYKATASQNFTNFAIGRSYSSTEGTACFTLPVPMRGTPTGSTPTVSGNFTYSLTVLLPAANYTSNNHVMTMNCTGAFTANGAFAVEAANTNAFIAWSAEL